MKCEISGCPNEADRRVTHAHKEPSLRWSACMCKHHAYEAHLRCANGEMIYESMEVYEVKHGQQDQD